mgnify:CR=1 FL=1
MNKSSLFNFFSSSASFIAFPIALSFLYLKAVSIRRYPTSIAFFTTCSKLSLCNDEDFMMTFCTRSILLFARFHKCIHTPIFTDGNKQTARSEGQTYGREAGKKTEGKWNCPSFILVPVQHDTNFLRSIAESLTALSATSNVDSFHPLVTHVHILFAILSSTPFPLPSSGSPAVGASSVTMRLTQLLKVSSNLSIH